ERLGIELNGSVPVSIKTRLGQRSDKFSDPVFRDLTRLIQQAGLTSEEVQDLCKGVLDITSGDQERLDFISSERVAREDQIRLYVPGGKRKVPGATDARPRMKWFVDRQATELVDSNPHSRDDYLRLT